MWFSVVFLQLLPGRQQGRERERGQGARAHRQGRQLRCVTRWQLFSFDCAGARLLLRLRCVLSRGFGFDVRVAIGGVFCEAGVRACCVAFGKVRFSSALRQAPVCGLVAHADLMSRCCCCRYTGIDDGAAVRKQLGVGASFSAKANVSSALLISVNAACLSQLLCDAALLAHCVFVQPVFVLARLCSLRSCCECAMPRVRLVLICMACAVRSCRARTTSSCSRPHRTGSSLRLLCWCTCGSRSLAVRCLLALLLLLMFACFCCCCSGLLPGTSALAKL